jgi:hypothetical protein
MKIKAKASGIHLILNKYKWRIPQLASHSNIGEKTLRKMLKEEEVNEVFLHYLSLAYSTPIEELTYDVI